MWDEEYEKAMLFYVIFENEKYLLDEEDFVDERNKKIIKAINELKTENKDISIISIKSKIKGDGAKILKYLSGLGDYIRTTSPDEIYGKIIEMSKKRKLLRLLDTEKDNISDSENIDILAEKIIKEINAIEAVNKKEKTFAEQVTDVMFQIEENTLKGTDYSLYTGITDLDNITCGLHKQELTIIGARPGVGKTTLALQISEYIASKGIETAFVSLEMSNFQIIQKMITKRTKVNSYKMRLGTLEEQDLEKIGLAGAEIAELPINLITSARTIQHIENIARKLKNKNNLGLLVIDYIQLIKNKGKFNNREQEVADITRTLKLLSLELDIPIIGLCQLNRNASKAEPTLADLRESGSIEQDADNVLFLYRENEKEENIVDTTLKIAKQRAGETGKIYLKFNKENSEFKGVIRC